MSAAKPAPRSWLRVTTLLQSLVLLLAIAGLCIYFTASTEGRFAQPRNLSLIAQQIAINAILAAGMTFVIISGGIDLSVGSVMAVAAVVAADVMVHLTQRSPTASPALFLVALAAGIGAGGAAGAINAAAVNWLRMPPFIATLAMMTAARGLAYLYTDARAIGDLPASFGHLGRAYLVPVMLAVIAAGACILHFTRFGRHVYALGSNTGAARLSGVPVTRVRASVYLVSGLLAGLAGVCIASRLGSGDPKVGELAELDAITAVVLGGASLSGGRGSILCSLLGALLIGILANGLLLRDVPTFTQMIARGGLIFAAVALDRLRPQEA